MYSLSPTKDHALKITYTLILLSVIHCLYSGDIDLGLDTFFRSWVLDLLMIRPQVVRIHNSPSSSLTQGPGVSAFRCVTYLIKTPSQYTANV